MSYDSIGVLSYMEKTYKYMLLLLLACSPVFGQTASNFVDAVKLAKEERKLILVHFWHDTCGPCKLQAARIFQNAKYKAQLEKEFIFVKVNTNKEPLLMRHYNITSVPTEILMKPQGEEISRFNGSTDPEYYIREAVLHKTEFKHYIRSKKGNK